MGFIFTIQNKVMKPTKTAFRKTVAEFIAFAKKPTLIAEDTLMTTRQKVSYIKELIKFKLLLLLVFMPIILLTKRFLEVQYAGIGEGWLGYITLVIIAPVMEEIIFRYALRFSKSVAALVVSAFFGYTSYLFLNDTLHIGIGIALSICGFPIFRIAFEYFEQPIQAFWKKHFTLIFHFLAITFGLIHLTNYENVSNYIFAIPLILSQLVSGYALGFVRLKFGLKYSILQHAAWNFITGTVLLIELVKDYL